MTAETKLLQQNYDNLAPDGSQIRLLLKLRAGGVAHCTLEPGQVSQAVAHKTVEEVWYFLEGQGEVWREPCDPPVVEAVPGVCLTIPTGTRFQFRCTGTTPLRFLIITLPPWPGADEAYRVADYWRTDEQR
ncbi:MAG TPA: cupin domain-containing protein [Phototrophicaceae bacterium]|nr:cupin domain-containing protein [Phototrophicaceae bacterium]